MTQRPNATFECLTCEHEWRGFVGAQECPRCGSLSVDWLNYVHPEELLGAPLPQGTPRILPNRLIYLRSEEPTREPPLGQVRIRYLPKEGT